MNRSKTYSRRLPILPGTGVPSTFGVEELNFCVRNGNRCGLSAITTGKLYIIFFWLLFDNHIEFDEFRSLQSLLRSSPRPISTSQLRTLLLFHIWPIYQLIFLESYYLNGMGDLILRRVSRLDAFSAYPCRS